MDHVVVRIGQLEHVYGTVESTRGGKLRYESDTAEGIDCLVDLVEEYRDLQDLEDGARYRELPNDEFLRRWARRCTGVSIYGLWVDIVEDRPN